MKKHDLGKYVAAGDGRISSFRRPEKATNCFRRSLAGDYGPGSEDIVVGKTPKATPWRVLLINSRPGGLIESNYLILNLSHPSVLPDTSWIEPGKAAWDWWSGRLARNVNFEPGMNTATMMHYIDFAAEHHIEYMLIDGEWSPFNDITRTIPEIDMPAIIAPCPEQGRQSAPLDAVDRGAGAGRCGVPSL